MFEVPQEMGLIAIAGRQTQGKGQSSFVSVALTFLLKNLILEVREPTDFVC
jgi:hypothetical protein